MELRKCGECAHAQQADASIRRVLADARYCPVIESYVRTDETQCRDFTERGDTLSNLSPRTREEV